MSAKEEILFDKIRALPEEKIAEVEDFVDFLRIKNLDTRLTQSAAKLSEPALSKVWDNEDDAEYDRI